MTQPEPTLVTRVAAALAAVYDNNPGSAAVEIDMRAARAAIEAMRPTDAGYNGSIAGIVVGEYIDAALGE